MGCEVFLSAGCNKIAGFLQSIHCSDELIFAALLLLFVERGGLVFLEAVVALTDDSLDGRELARLLLNTHCEMRLLIFVALPEFKLFFTTSKSRIGSRQELS